MCDSNIVGLTVLSREQGFALEHFREDAACAPDVDCNIILLPS